MSGGHSLAVDLDGGHTIMKRVPSGVRPNNRLRSQTAAGLNGGRTKQNSRRETGGLRFFVIPRDQGTSLSTPCAFRIFPFSQKDFSV